MLVAFGIIDTKKRARQFVNNRTSQELNELYRTLTKQAKYNLLND